MLDEIPLYRRVDSWALYSQERGNNAASYLKHLRLEPIAYTLFLKSVDKEGIEKTSTGFKYRCEVCRIYSADEPRLLVEHSENHKEDESKEEKKAKEALQNGPMPM